MLFSKIGTFLVPLVSAWFNASRDRWAAPDDPRIREDARMHTHIDQHHVTALDSTMAYREVGASGRAVVLFLHGAYDVTCETMTSRLAEPMRRECADLTEVVVPSGHWMAQEQPVAVNAALARWLATKLSDYWQG